MRSRTWLWIVTALLVGQSLVAQIPESERIPITDPGRLEKMGFRRDARTVFEWSKRDRSGEASVGERAVATPETWGTGVGSSTVYGYELQAHDTDVHLGKSLQYGGGCYEGGGLDTSAFVRIPVPEGARLGVFRSWAYDNDPDQDLTIRVWETCQPYGYDPPASTLIAETSTLGSIGQYPGTKSLNGLTVDTQTCVYSVEVEFAPYGGEDCSNNLTVQKLQFTWTRQVSPAPATATFNDVPTNHQFFQFIEALAKSGITGGCSLTPPLFCPDQPLTRGQMAAFLAKGLGLQWP